MAKTDNRKAVRAQQEREKARRQQQLADLVAVMGAAEGRRLVWRFIAFCNPLGSAFNTNAMAQSHTIGWQDAGKWWLTEIEAACPEKYAVMANEARRAAKDAALQAQLDEKEQDDDD